MFLPAAEERNHSRSLLDSGHALRGFCAVTRDNPGDCSKPGKGSWPISVHQQTGPYTLELCAERCAKCDSCHYVSLSTVNKECSWYTVCNPPLRTDMRGLSYVTIQIRGVEGGIIPRPPADKCTHKDALPNAARRQREAAVAVLDQAALSWARHSSPGSCAPEHTSIEHAIGRLPDCSNDRHGVFSLEESHTDSLEEAAHVCLNHCVSCANCQFLSISLADRICAWHASCDTPDTRLTPCNFRSGLVPDSVRSSRRAALIFYGKHATSNITRPQEADPHEKARVDFMRAAAGDWASRLVLANPMVRFDIFAHSWSPELASSFADAWWPLVVSHAHEPTHYVPHASRSTHLAFRCGVDMINCARTASQLLSVSRAILLKRDHEVLLGVDYPLVFVTRHDLMVRSDLTLHEVYWPTEVPGPSRDIWFMAACSGTCSAAAGASLPPNCELKGRLCPIDYAQDIQQQYFIAPDWIFMGASHVTDTMGDVLRNYNPLSQTISRYNNYVSTHYLWPMHALNVGLKVRWGLHADIVLSRYRYISRPR